ncbi:Protein kinase domain [Macleaya cordata]|uniref:Protein kinase domain n=1 Tax=Macleaya cordata TaxID=56857 RepID=A0A200RDP9_MACCD|nr:Protein kinase domain [Macleaya cordata]
MVLLPCFICVYCLVFLIQPILSSQFYDITECHNPAQVPGSNYLCNTNRDTCDTFIVYRAQPNFQSLSSISSLFNTSQTQLLTLNNLTESTSNDLLGREIIIPINCSCSGRFSQAVFTYNSSGSDTFSTIACEVYEGLLKLQSLVEQNPGSNSENSQSFEVAVPVRCACPDRSDTSNGVQYLVTYPVAEAENKSWIGSKFGVSEETICAANNLELMATIYTNTTLLIPMNQTPVLNLEFASSVDPAPSPVSVIPLEKVLHTSSKNRNFYILGVGVLTTTLLLLVALGVFLSIRKEWMFWSFQPWSSRSSELSSFSQDFLDGMSKVKHSLLSFSLDDLRIATGNFCEDSVIGSSIYRGRIGDSIVAIEQMGSEEEAHRVIDILTKINHLNIVKLEGFCPETRAYIVFEFAANGCLRDCLSNVKVAKELTWSKRMQILSDVAVGLHYMHHYTSPSYVHSNINSKNVLITMDWRAKISGFKLAKPITWNEEKNEKNKWNESVIMGRMGYLAPEYLYYGSVSSKVDVYAFGVVLLELISAKEALMDGCMLKDSVEFLVNADLEATSGCVEKLKGFMDPALEEGKYPLRDALCLALLAKGCLEEDPHHRPTMNDVLKAISRIVYPFST